MQEISSTGNNTLIRALIYLTNQEAQSALKGGPYCSSALDGGAGGISASSMDLCLYLAGSFCM